MCINEGGEQIMHCISHEVGHMNQTNATFPFWHNANNQRHLLMKILAEFLYSQHMLNGASK